MGATWDKIKGKAKKAQGEITGDRSKKAEGTFDELKGRVKEAVEHLKKDAEYDIKHPPE
jgi:uncharacterized protein YjbJ (UPF0337 family)